MSKRKPAIMLISITVPDKVVRAAQDNNMSIEEFVDTLIDKGMAKETGRPMVSSAIERIRALHTGVVPPRR
jgi:heme O synthase-like polyprenyltransferase